VKYDTDKDWRHGYIPDYLRLARALGPAAVACEVGVHEGGSLAMWQDLFPQGMVIGVDNDPSCTWPEGTRRVIAEQDDPALAVMVAGHALAGCDLIVDDASHVGQLSMATFALLWPLVRPGGFYVVEDWADPWVNPLWMRTSQANPEHQDLVDVVPGLITALKDGARTVEYTREGLVIIRRQA